VTFIDATALRERLAAVARLVSLQAAVGTPATGVDALHNAAVLKGLETADVIVTELICEAERNTPTTTRGDQP